MSGCDIAREYFVSKYINPSCHPKDMVRRLTYPYLRRCALLWELLRSSSAVPLYDSSNIWEGSHLYLSNSTADGSSSLTMELDGIRELEHLFQIQSLDLILQDESVHMLALKWSQHFCEDYSSRKYRGVLFSTPAVPFRLMQLPPVYQILLERFNLNLLSWDALYFVWAVLLWARPCFFLTFGANSFPFFPLDMWRCNALIVARCLMNQHCVCFVANYVRLVGSHAAGDSTLVITVPIPLVLVLL